MLVPQNEDPFECLDVVLDAVAAVLGPPLEVRVFQAVKVELDDLCLVRDPEPDALHLAPCPHFYVLAAQFLQVVSDRPDGRTQEDRQVLLCEQRTLFV